VTGAARIPVSVARSLVVFLVSFFLLQWGWNAAREGPLEHWIIDRATVGTSVAIIDRLTPGAEARAIGPRIWAPDGGINVRRGCEGTEVLFLLVAALLAYPFRWTLRVGGLLFGSVLVFSLNQLRLLALFYSARSAPALFAQLHGLIAPLFLVAGTLLFFVLLLSYERGARPAA
jgi:exosortase/archaeosortase family protein